MRKWEISRGLRGHGRTAPLWLVAVASIMMVPLLSAVAIPVLASPVMSGPETAPSPVGDPTGEEAAFGEKLDRVDGGLLAHGRRSFEASTATLMVSTGNGLVATTTIEANGTIAGSQSTVIAVEHDGSDAVLRRYAIADNALSLVQEIPLTDVGEHYGDQIAVSDHAVVVTRPYAPADATASGDPAEPDGFDIFVPGDDGNFWLAQQVSTELSHLYPAIAADGATVIMSGSEPFAFYGSAEIYYRTAGTDRWEKANTLERVGGGKAVIDGADVFVQRNGYFARPADTWTALSYQADQLTVAGLIPTKGSTLSVSDTVIAVGNPATERVMLFDRQLSGSGSFRFLQTVSPEAENDGRFGASVVAYNEKVIVGVPGLTVDGVSNEGGLTTYEIVDGPIGCTIVGTPGNDILVGTERRDVICGLEGDDEISGLAGNDFIIGGPGDDTIEGNSGRDLIFGGEGNDTIRGGSEDDLIFGEAGFDEINGGDGADNLHGGNDGDIIRGGADDDFLYGDAGDDQIFGEEDNDFADGGPGVDIVRGGDDEDTLHGGPDNDQLFGGQGDDVLSGGLGYDRADGGHDTDWCDRTCEVCTRASWENHRSVEDATGSD